MSLDEAKLAVSNVLVGLKLITEAQKEELMAGKLADIEFAGLGIDSMAVINLCVGLEERFGREIAVEELIENPTVGKLADHFAKESA